MNYSVKYLLFSLILVLITQACSSNRMVIQDSSRNNNYDEIYSFYQKYRNGQRAKLIISQAHHRESSRFPEKIKITKKGKIIYSHLHLYGWTKPKFYERFKGESLNFYELICNDSTHNYRFLTSIDTCKYIYATIVRPKKKNENLTYQKIEIRLESIKLRHRSSF